MPSVRFLFLSLVLISSVSCIVRSRSGGSKAGGGGGGGSGWGPAILYMNNSAVPTRNETDLQNCLQSAIRNAAQLATSIICKDVSYSFSASSPCSNPQMESRDRSSTQSMVCGSNSSSVCYQTTTEKFVSAFAEYTNILKPYLTTWKCTGKDQFCCGFECCTTKKETRKWIWIVVVLLVFLVILPSLIIAIYCVYSKNKAKNGAASDQSNQGSVNYNFNNAAYNAPPRAY